MYDLKEADKIREEQMRKDSSFDTKLVLEWREQMPHEFSKKMYEIKYGCHIWNEELYDEAVSLLAWADKSGSGAKWTVEDLVKLSGIDFAEKDYYEFDYAYVANMMYSDYCHIFTEQSYYLKMAKAYLEDTDFMGNPSERAYHNAMNRIKYNSK